MKPKTVMSKKNWYDKYVGKSSKKDSHHSFWADEFETDYESPIYKDTLSESQIDTLKKYRLSSARKAIGNFVTIATGKQIPVTYSSSNQSYTDGKTVTLSGDIDDTDKFDVGVGLALHEGSHILLSDFGFLAALSQNIPDFLKEGGQKKGDADPVMTIQQILNVVEDRRIDNYIYTNAPGYRSYYLSLYEKYFGDKVVTEALTGDEWKSETIENYMNRLINLMNPATSLTALKGMRAIWNVLDIKNIGRLKTTLDAFGVALEIYGIMLDNVPDTIGKKSGGKNGDQKNGKQEGQSPNAGDDQQDRGGQSVGSDGEGESSESDDTGDSSEGEGEGKESKSDSGMSAAKRKRLEKVLNEQKDFLKGKTRKKKITKAMADDIEAAEASGAEIQHVADGMKDRYGNVGKGVDVVVYKTLTRKMLEAGAVKIASVGYKGGLNNELSDNELATAERMGTQLGKKLQVRNEARTTVFNRQRNGKIDKRLVHSLGFDAESVFTQLHVDKYKRANIHLSLDASSSMGGSKWTQTLINTIALAKAVSMISNLSMQVSIRYTEDKLPAVVMAWDSRKSSYKDARLIFPHLRPHGTTPEGLCFEAISKLMVVPSADMDSYFVNISDGEPCFTSSKIEYVGQRAHEHTRKEVEKLTKAGIGVLSYFVSEYAGRQGNEAFRAMYGKYSRFINVTNVNEVSKTMNELFLNKNVAA